MKAYKVNKVIGEFSDDSWQHANILDDFSYPWQDDLAPPMTFRALHDRNNFYFKYEVVDPNKFTYVEKNDKMEVVNSERVEIFFQVDEKLETYYCLELDPNERVLDYKASFYRQMQFDWQWPDSALKVKTTCSKSGYELTGQINIQSLRQLGILKGDRIKAGLFRGECTGLEGSQADLKWISWVDPLTKEPDFHVPSAFGELQFN
ncbi:MAG: carbohydrate-binding family 9-like protein [Cyclobacteriaceae bacterium]